MGSLAPSLLGLCKVSLTASEARLAVFDQVAPHRNHATSFSRVSQKSRCRSAVQQEVRPVVPVTTGGPRLSLWARRAAFRGEVSFWVASLVQ